MLTLAKKHPQTKPKQENETLPVSQGPPVLKQAMIPSSDLLPGLFNCFVPVLASLKSQV